MNASAIENNLKKISPKYYNGVSVTSLKDMEAVA